MSNLVEYKPGSTFPGVIGRTVAESSPAWPKPARAKQGAPNVIVLILDDVGYGQMSAVGVVQGDLHGRCARGEKHPAV